MLVRFGTYVGTGSALAITGLGFSPDVVLVKGGANIAVLRTSTMGADSAKPLNGATALSTGRITSLDPDGFTLGTNAQTNANGTTYYWMALKALTGQQLKVGTYTGNGSTQSITGVGFQPNAVWAIPATARAPFLATSSMTAGQSIRMDAGQAATTLRITSLDADGFSVGAASEVNTNTDTIHYIALKNQTAAFEVLVYTGNGSDDRNVTTASFGPDGAVLKVNSSTVTTTAGAARFKDEVGDLSFQLDATDAAADKIQSFLSNGLQVGTAPCVNENTKPVYGLLFKTFIGGTAKDALMMGVG